VARSTEEVGAATFGAYRLVVGGGAAAVVRLTSFLTLPIIPLSMILYLLIGVVVPITSDDSLDVGADDDDKVGLKAWRWITVKQLGMISVAMVTMTSINVPVRILIMIVVVVIG